MDGSLQARARDTECYAGALRELAKHLPPDDDALEAALTQFVAERDGKAFSHLLLAALDARRRVDGRILENGAGMLITPGMLLAAAVHCTGNVGGALMAAIGGGQLSTPAEVLALALTAWWSRECAGCDVPAEAIRRGRVLARGDRTAFEVEMLIVLGDLSGDPDLAAFPSALSERTYSVVRRSFDNWVERTTKDVLAYVPEERSKGLSGYTVRRAVARVGRNEPCPCGSGKKYKRCCLGVDQERLRHSSDVEGVTIDEVRKNPEAYLTLERLFGMSSSELGGIDATRVAGELHGPLILRLCEWRNYEAVAGVFEAVGWSMELDGCFGVAVESAAAAGQEDVVKRLVALLEEGDDEGLSLAVRIMGTQLEPGAMLELIESTTRDSLDEPFGPVDIAYALLASRYPVLGILVARGALWTAPFRDGFVLLHRLLTARDRIGLSPVDPVEDLIEAHWDEEFDDLESEEDGPIVDTETRRELELKLAESRKLRAELRQRDEALQEMERKLRQVEERDASAKAEQKKAATNQGAYDAALVDELRRKLAERKAEVKEKHAERNSLRDELARARQEVEALRGMKTDETRREGSKAEPAAPEDDPLLFPTDDAESQPPRLPCFERQFGDDLRDVPAKVARGALRLIGRLAAGESAAFRGARHLSSHNEIWRQRVGIGHRLLFRTEDETLIVLRLVTREDLKRAVRSL